MGDGGVDDSDNGRGDGAPGRRTRQRLPGDSFDDDESSDNEDGRAAWPGGDGGG